MMPKWYNWSPESLGSAALGPLSSEASLNRAASSNRTRDNASLVNRRSSSSEPAKSLEAFAPILLLDLPALGDGGWRLREMQFGSCPGEGFSQKDTKKGLWTGVMFCSEMWLGMFSSFWYLCSAES